MRRLRQLESRGRYIEKLDSQLAELVPVDRQAHVAVSPQFDVHFTACRHRGAASTGHSRHRTLTTAAVDRTLGCGRTLRHLQGCQLAPCVGCEGCRHGRLFPTFLESLANILIVGRERRRHDEVRLRCGTREVVA